MIGINGIKWGKGDREGRDVVQRKGKLKWVFGDRNQWEEVGEGQ